MDDAMRKTAEQMQEAIDRINDNKREINTMLSGCSYANGLVEALEWAMGTLEDYEFTGTNYEWKNLS